VPPRMEGPIFSWEWIARSIANDVVGVSPGKPKARWDGVLHCGGCEHSETRGDV
jgi:hypothetical protein